MAGVVLVNPASGPDDTDLDALRERFEGHRVVECRPEDLGDEAAAAVKDGADFVAVAGGDGTIRLAAAQLAGTGVPLLPVPEGTRNHFAHDVGIDDLDDAARAQHGRRAEVDIGRVNGHYFVNNSSVGLYPKIVIRRERHQRRLGKGTANVVAAYDQLRSGAKVRVEVDGVSHVAWMVFVGNGVYGVGLLDLTDRDRLDANVLDLRIVRADEPLSRLRVVGALLLGRLARSPLVIRRHTPAVTIHLDRATVDVALDGEVETLEPPLVYESLAGQLTVLRPS
jgi:diacylglycerol kinase family enzyme